MPRREQYMCRVSDKYTKKSSAQTCLQLQQLRIYVMRPCSTYTSHMTLVKCRASPEGTTTERSVYPLQGVQTQSAGVKEVFRRKTCEGIQKLLLIPSRREQYMRQAKCSRKREHLNPAKMRVQACNMLTTNVLQGFRRQYLRFRCSVGRKGRQV